MSIESLDKLKDDELLYILSLMYGAYIPIWEKCSKEEYEKYYGSNNLTLESIIKYFNSPNEYKKVPYWNTGGGILEQISGKEPDGYQYYKLKDKEFTLMLGSEMINYLNDRKPEWYESSLFKKF